MHQHALTLLQTMLDKLRELFDTGLKKNPMQSKPMTTVHDVKLCVTTPTCFAQ